MSGATDLTKMDPGALGKEFEEIGLDQQAYEALEKDFQEVLNELVGDQSMERFRNEYEKLHRALKTSYESEKRLIKRCKELNDTILANAARVKAAIKLTQEDSQTINLLKKEVDKAWKLVDQAKDKEEKARKIIQDLRAEIAHLNKIVEQGSGLSIGQDNTVHNLMRQKDELKRDSDKKQEQIDELTTQQNNLLEKLHKLENDIIKERDGAENLKKDLSNVRDEKVREERKNKTYEEEKNTLIRQKDDKENEIKKLESEKQEKDKNLEAQQKKYAELDGKFKRTEEAVLKQQKDNSVLDIEISQLRNEKHALIAQANQFDFELGEKKSRL
jgi:chromosome segregation ATPase